MALDQLLHIIGMGLRIFTASLFLLFSQVVMANGLVCINVLGADEPTINLYDEVRTVVSFNTVSNDLTDENKAKIRVLIFRLKGQMNEFEESYNSLLAPYGTEFLPRVREKLDEMNADFRKKIWMVINQLERFMSSGGIIFRQLGIIDTLNQLRLGQVERFLHNPDQVYFGLDYFVNTIEIKQNTAFWGAVRLTNSFEELEGYRVNNDAHLDTLGLQVRTLNFLENDVTGDTFPETDITVIKELEANGIPFSGFPLTREFLDFLQLNGSESGHILVVKKPYTKPDPSLVENLGFSSSNPRQTYMNFIDRFNPATNTYYEIRTESGNIFYALSNPGYYEFSEYGHLLVPGARVEITRERNRLGRPIGVSYMLNHEGADSVAYPTPYELLFSLVHKAYFERYIED